LIIAKILWKTEKKTVKDSKMCGKEMIIRILQRSICTMQHSCTGETLSVRHHGGSSYSLMPWSIQHMLASRMGSIKTDGRTAYQTKILGVFFKST
jgi:hypothetical protein